MDRLVEVAVPLPVNEFLTYRWELEDEPVPGTRIVVPVGKRSVAGVLWRETPDTDLPPEKLKSVKSLLDAFPLLPQSLMELLEWAAEYYFYPPGLAVSEAMPPGFLPSRSRNIESLITAPISKGKSRFHLPRYQADSIKELTAAQANVLRETARFMESRSFVPVLLHGVTGSGKTEVYIRAVRKCLELGRNALVLVPEIAMTSQIASWFTAHFGDSLALLHSGMTAMQRHDQWLRIRAGDSRVVIGTRSGIFVPMDDTGLIIVDEEHDPSYKQDERFLYNARDIAIMRGKMSGATVVLGSATPSVTTYHNACSGRFRLLEMKSRVSDRCLPAVEIIDRRLKKKKNGTEKREVRTGIRRWLSPGLEQALREVVSRREQAIFFLNRRGFATYIFCPDCGHVFVCRNCDVTMTWHRNVRGNRHGAAAGINGALKCHYCGDELPGMPLCPECGGHGVRARGVGTEKVVAELAALLPDVRIARIDRDAATSRKRLETMLSSFRRGEYDILVGTQMISKGHDFPEVTLVGIISADSALNVPEYNASERTFQLVAQVAGRAGRGDKPGKVVIQTYSPDHYSMVYAASHDYPSFYRHETKVREPLGYPPYGSLANIRFSGVKKGDVAEHATVIANEVRKIIASMPKDTPFPVDILGPAPAPLARINRRYRFNLLLKSPSRQAVRHACHLFLKTGRRIMPSRIRMDIDVDPVKFT